MVPLMASRQQWLSVFRRHRSWLNLETFPRSLTRSESLRLKNVRVPAVALNSPGEGLMNNRSLGHRVLVGLLQTPVRSTTEPPTSKLSLSRRVLAGLFGVPVRTGYSPPPEPRPVPVRSPVLVSVGPGSQRVEELADSVAPRLNAPSPKFHKPWGYLAVIVFVDLLGMAIQVGLVLSALRQPYVALQATGWGLLWPLVRSVRRRYRFETLGENYHFSPLVADWLVFIALVSLVRPIFGFATDFEAVLVAVLPGLVVSYSSGLLLGRRLLTDRREARRVHRVLVVGESAAADYVVGRLASLTDHPYGVVGVVAIGGDITCFPAAVGRLPRGQLPSAADATTIISSAAAVNADLVLLTQGSDLMGRRLRRVIWGLQDAGFPLVMLTPPEDVSTHRLLMRTAAGLTVFHVLPPSGYIQAALKKLIDWIGALLLIVLLAPLLLGIGVAIWLGSRGPILFLQVRVGKYGRPFVMYKFRTMALGSDRRPVVNADASVGGRMFKMRRDPRITRVGGLLRRLSLDELPQLLNVLRGEMSLVGPRPPLPEEVEMYDETELRRLKVKPGITGAWQVSGRSDLSWDECVKLDLYYVDNWSLPHDFRILARTLRAVINGRGAY
ncbi:exopolysaccharide biosynthesis polyprenyl glycosylphosphotransferase [Streptomyces sp. NPDC014864]|uniref:exopolysaccharide biosynthesis polyprenyl glycosylphosphotransferase n=1 Tax=Streptomyces sp. NPDC014864 TaxID=3364924 RepID=UPI0036FF6D66